MRKLPGLLPAHCLVSHNRDQSLQSGAFWRTIAALINLNQATTLNARFLPSLLLLATLISGCAATNSTIDYAGGQSATATIEIPNHISARSINGEAIKLPFTISYPYSLQVAEGPVELVFLYSQDWGQTDRDTVRIKSDIMSLNFNAVAGKAYSVDFKKPNSTSNPDNAYYYTRNFESWLNDESGQIVKASNTGKSANSLSTIVVNALEPAKTVKTTEPAEISGAELDELKRIWKQASEEDRKQFMNWVISPSE